MVDNRARSISITILIISLFMSSVPAFTCDVPIFRYALERWPADVYEIFVFYQKTLSSEETSIVEWLETSSITHVSYANYRVHTVNLSLQTSGPLLELWETLDYQELPSLAICYPGSFPDRECIWSGPLTMNSAKAVVDSPVRQEIARRILDGESAVWMLLECGDRSKDAAAAELLQSQLSLMEDKLTLPEMVLNSRTVLSGDDGYREELRCSFSFIRLSQTDSEESAFISMLMHSEPDLFEYTSYPKAFTVYGRGRILYALVGDGITKDNIYRACSSVIGSCSCEVKALHPGVDLLIPVDWDGSLKENWTEDLLPPLVGLSELIRTSAEHDSSESNPVFSVSSDSSSAAHDSLLQTVMPLISSDDHGPAYSPHTTELSSHVLRNILLALGILIMITFVLSLKVMLFKRGE